LIKKVIRASEHSPFGIIDTMKVSFGGLDLTDIGIHKIKFYTALDGDMRTSNDTLSMEMYSKACQLGDITQFTSKKDTIYLQCHQTKFRIQFLRDDLFRIWMAYDGIFTNPAGHDLIINKLKAPVHLATEDKGAYYLMRTPNLTLRAYKNPLHFALYKSDNKTLIWKEVRGITYGKQTIQYLKRGKEEQFYGGGMQNGRFSHRGDTIKMTIDYDWEDGGNPNPATFYMSTKGYGTVRNTYTTGYYYFGDTIKTVHNESRFDCYYFVNDSLKVLLNDYTDLTGKPFLVPKWGLGMGDSNCYNRGAKSGKTNGSTSTGYDGLTPSVIHLIADKYIEEKMPRGWIIPNDGYGCGYTKLDSVVQALHKRGFYTGLWTENGVSKIAREVGVDGSRLCKLDVAWVGPGFHFAMNAAKTAYEGIEDNSNARGFVWMVCGWTGAQRYSVLWTGDQNGSWNYIRWHIPTVIGSGLSAQNYATGDVDGIFGGSDSTYTRDLEWKCFTPVFMAMSGWAYNNKNGIKDKQPWLFGEPFTSINRKYLMLKERMTPYMYTLCYEASQTGVPAVRALVLEYPKDSITWGNATKYEYLLGKSLLVAPVFKSQAYRDSIYLPAGEWIDYWNGDRYKGHTTLMHYPAPLDKLPLFVRAGAIIPMYQPMMYNWERPIDTLTLDIYPQGKSSFVMYEDDGLTRDYRKGMFATTQFEVHASATGEAPIAIILHAAKGTFKEKQKNRVYLLVIHSMASPKKIFIGSRQLKQEKNAKSFLSASSGWYYDLDQKGIIQIKTPTLSTDETTVIQVR
jgi:alpha-glucosidase (family GH31 glycosyl hydrolase)